MFLLLLTLLRLLRFRCDRINKALEREKSAEHVLFLYLYVFFVLFFFTVEIPHVETGSLPAEDVDSVDTRHDDD